LVAGSPITQVPTTPRVDIENHSVNGEEVSLSVEMVDGNNNDNDKTPVAQLQKFEYYRYIANSLKDPSIVEDGMLPQYLIMQSDNVIKKLQNEISITNHEKEVLQQKVNGYEQICKNQSTQSIERYPMDKYPHGLAVIITIAKFHSMASAERALPDRIGALIDENNLRILWESFGYKVVTLMNPTASELMYEVENYASQSHENYDSFVCIINSHFDGDHIIGADAKPVKLDKIIARFTKEFCPTLHNKPKLFFIQGCRIDENCPLRKYENPLPEPDFLISYSTLPGYYSYRNPENGSLYIFILCKTFKTYAAQRDLLQMLQIVRDEMSVTPIKRNHPACSECKTSLRKNVWFFQSPSSKQTYVLKLTFTVMICIIIFLVFFLLL